MCGLTLKPYLRPTHRFGVGSVKKDDDDTMKYAPLRTEDRLGFCDGRGKYNNNILNNVLKITMNICENSKEIYNKVMAVAESFVELEKKSTKQLPMPLNISERDSLITHPTSQNYSPISGPTFNIQNMLQISPSSVPSFPAFSPSNQSPSYIIPELLQQSSHITPPQSAQFSTSFIESQPDSTYVPPQSQPKLSFRPFSFTTNSAFLFERASLLPIPNSAYIIPAVLSLITSNNADIATVACSLVYSFYTQIQIS
jgi:hypothetical protein